MSFQRQSIPFSVQFFIPGKYWSILDDSMDFELRANAARPDAGK